MYGPDELRRLAADAVQAGRLPSDPSVPFAATVRADNPCSLCGEPLTAAPAFRLLSADHTFVLHTDCFSAWIYVVVEPTSGPGGAM